MKQVRKEQRVQCLNGPACEFLKKGKCFFFHPLKHRPQNVAGTTEYLKSQNHQLSDLVQTLSFKVAALEEIVKAMAIYVPQFKESLGEGHWAYHMACNNFKLENLEAVVGSKELSPVVALLTSY